jgi:hypothetical protein
MLTIGTFIGFQCSDVIMKKSTPTVTTLTFSLDNTLGSKYIDIAQCLSAINRRLYRQGKKYYVSQARLLAMFPETDPDANDLFADATVAISLIPDTWVTANAWKKSFALWQKMNLNVLKDNPSVKGTWADFKMFMDSAHYNGGANSSGPNINLLPIDVANGQVLGDEWYMSRYVAPQHEGEVQAPGGTGATVLPKDADEYNIKMLGPTLGSADALQCVGAVDGYQTTRAMVQVSPDVPALMQDNWMTRLTDEGSQDPELANVIEDANDHPPYDIDEYPGGATNMADPLLQDYGMCTIYNHKAFLNGFCAPLGLLKVDWALGRNAKGNYGECTLRLQLDLMPGTYKGVMATEVSQ